MTRAKFPRRVRINVTKQDIKRGVPHEPDSCPIARAAKRSFGRKAYVEVMSSVAVLKRGGEEEVNYRYTEKAGQFIENFDNGNHVEPFSFTAERVPQD